MMLHTEGSDFSMKSKTNSMLTVVNDLNKL